MIIGITGTDGAGKGTVVEYLVTKKGFVHHSVSGFITKEVTKQGLPISRNQLRLTGNELREKYGDDVLVALALKEIEEKQDSHAIVESIRATAEAETLKAYGGVLVAVDADPHVRYDRVQGRRSEKDQVTFEEFFSHEELEKNDPNPHGMQKAKVMEMADYTILNNGSLEELEAAVEQFLRTYGN
jgi:dephospho-CoA kinase